MTNCREAEEEAWTNCREAEEEAWTNCREAEEEALTNCREAEEEAWTNCKKPEEEAWTNCPGEVHKGQFVQAVSRLFHKGHPPSADLRYGEEDSISPST